MNYFVNITSQGQISIPAKLRKKYNMDKAGQVLVRERGDTIVLTPIPDIMDLYGVFQHAKRLPWKEVRKKIDDAWAHGKI